MVIINPLRASPEQPARIEHTIQHISIQNDSHNKIKDKPRNAYFLTASLENKKK